MLLDEDHRPSVAFELLSGFSCLSFLCFLLHLKSLSPSSHFLFLGPFMSMVLASCSEIVRLSR